MKAIETITTRAAYYLGQSVMINLDNFAINNGVVVWSCGTRGGVRSDGRSCGTRSGVKSEGWSSRTICMVRSVG